MAEDETPEAPGVLRFEILRAIPNNWLTFQPSGLKIEMETGEVVIPEGLTLSDAAREFWEAVSAFRRPGFW